VGLWRDRAAQRSTNGRQQALAPAADPRLSLLPATWDGKVCGGQAKVRGRPGGRGSDGGVGWCRAQALRALSGSTSGRLHGAAVSDCSAEQSKSGCRSAAMWRSWPAVSGRQVQVGDWTTYRCVAGLRSLSCKCCQPFEKQNLRDSRWVRCG